METAQESESGQDLLAEVDPFARPHFGADQLQASLEAVRIAQTAARARLRRETRWARIVAAGALMAVGATAWAAVHRPPKARAVETGPSVAAATPLVAAPEAAPSTAPTPREAPPADPPAPSEAAAPTERSGAAVAGGSDSLVSSLCDAAFEQRSWTAIAATCAAAFEARPQESALAMRVAQAQHRHGHVATAADWARKALALDADIPEAFVLVARAEVGAGNAPAAVDAYRQYLRLAPRGWHASEARRAVRAAR